MFARTLKIFGIGVALIGGTACNDGVDGWGDLTNTFAAVARGASVVPPATDTTPRAAVSFNGTSLAYTYNITTPPGGTIDSIALYQVAGGNPLPASATAILCAGPAACAATSGTARVVGPATAATIKTSMLAYGTQLVFFTATAQHAAGGAMRGTMYPNP